MIYESALDMIGNTPLLKLQRMHTEGAQVYGKCEFLNPGGSVKDRPALAMIEAAETEGLLTPDSIIIEPTSGNTGIALAMVGILKGYSVILTMPDSMSLERRSLLKAYGAKLELTPGHLGMTGAIERAKEIADQHGSRAFIPQQFENAANPSKHYSSTGPEIWEDTNGEITAFVAGIGTSGTMSGVGRYLKEKKASVQTIAVEPADSAVISGESAGPHMIQGIGAGFVPGNYNTKWVDEIIKIENDEAIQAARELAVKEGILVGISAGANVAAAIKIASRLNPSDSVVTMLCDVGERYLSTTLFNY